ncbi:hypothetical protein Ahy_B06g080443 [Arachis hypogaea]|uniref:F-box associated domain-containing protein n=1 Tax=Arachis hypogaea TaxID=3818 RepID=A0A444YI11_ARAHY|nr:hypothetical protein Ahy_B06g080443 [Arachis hypogaea]
MWRMERYGVGESWTSIFQYSASFDRNINSSIITSQLHGYIVYHDPENQEFRILFTPWYDDHFQIVHHVPSLIPLKDIIIGDNGVFGKLVGREEEEARLDFLKASTFGLANFFS